MKRPYFIFIPVLILSFFFTPILASQGATKLSVSVRFNKLVYRPADKMTVRGVINPSENVSDARASLKIGPKDNYVFARTIFLGNLKKGEKLKFEFTKNSAQNFGLKPGANPLLIEVTAKQKSIYKFSASLGLLDPIEKEKMKVALAVNLADKPYLDAEKNITNVSAVKKLQPTMDSYLRISQQNMGLINYIFSPILADTLKINSQKTLYNFNNLFEQNISQLILTTYSQADINRLSAKSLIDQIAEGRRTIESVFSKKITTGRLSAFPNQTISLNQKQDSTLPSTKALLKDKDKLAATIEAFAILSDSYNNNKKQVILATSNMANPQNITFFIKSAKTEKWLALKPLASLKPSKNKANFHYKRVSSVLRKARLKYFILKQALASDNSAFDQAKMAIYLAEDKNNDNAKSRQLAEKAFALLDGELKKVSLKLSALTLTGREGKLPIKIINNTGSKLNINLAIKTEGLQSKMQAKSFLIGPKENLLSIPVKVLKSGRHKVLVQLKTDGTVLTQKSFIVSTNLPSAFWLYSAVALALSLLLIVGAFYLRERRSKFTQNK